MNVVSSFLGKKAEELSTDIVTEIIKEADGDDYRLLDLLRENAEITKRHQEEIWDTRDAAAKRLRDAGVPMTEIAGWAGVADSYLSRRLIEKGAKRIMDRTRRTRRRRTGGTSGYSG